MVDDECNFDNSKGGINRLVFLHCSVTFVDINDIDEWCFYAKQGLLFITNDLIGEKPVGDWSMRILSSCSLEQAINKDNIVEFQDANADLVNFTEYLFWNFMMKNYKNYQFGYIKCDGTFSGFVRPFGFKVERITSDNNKDIDYWKGSVRWRSIYELVPVLIPDLVSTILDCEKLYDENAISQIPVECLSFGIVSSIANAITANGNDGSITITKVVGATTVEYSIDGGISWTLNPSFQGLAPGTYTVIARDFDRTQCVSEVTYNLINGCLTNPTFGVTYQKFDASGLSKGKIKLFITGGTGQFEIIVNGNIVAPENLEQIGQDGYYLLGNLEGGLYHIVVKDKIYLCSQTFDITLIDLCDPFVKVSNPVVVGSGAYNTGSITLPSGAVTGGTSPYSISIDNINYYAQLTNGDLVIENLPPDIYNVIVKDSNGCKLTYPAIEVVDLCASFDFVSVVPTGTGTFTSVGYITITATGGSGGVGNYLYSIEDVDASYQSSNVLSDLSLGTYTVWIKDKILGCKKSKSNITIVNICPALTLGNISIEGSGALNTGSITIGSYAGTINPVEYSKDGIIWQASNVLDNLAPGTYTVYVRDKLTLCVASLSGNFVENLCDLIWQGAIIVDAGSNNLGQITINVPVGGSGNYVYSIDGGNTYLPTNVFTTVSAGDYPVYIKDTDTQCVITQIVTVANACSTFTIDLVNIIPAGTEPIGEVIIHASGSSNNPANYEYSIDGGNTYQASNIFTDLPAGDINIAVHDTSNGCVTYNNDYTVHNMCEDLEMTISKTGAGINPTGSINVVSITGYATTPDIKYTISSPDQTFGPQSSPLFPNLLPNTWIVLAEDSISGCNISKTVVVPNICDQLAINAVPTPSGTTINTGTINIIAQGGSGSYLYSIDNGTTLTNATGMFTNVGIGTYSIIVADTFTGCQVAGSVTVPSICTTLQIANVGKLDSGTVPSGQIYAISVVNGSGDYDFTVDATTQTNNPIFTGLSQGPHLLTVKDNVNGCTTYTNVTIGNICTTFNFEVEPTGSGPNPSGQVSVTNVTGDQASGDYTYIYNGNPSLIDFETGLPQGTTSVIVTDNITGCSRHKNVTIGNICPSLVFSEFIIGSGAAPTGQVTIVGVNGGSGTYTYSIDALAPQASNSFNAVGQGSHIIRVIDGITGCITDHVINVPSICNLVITSVDSTTPGTIVINTVTGNISNYANLEYGLNNLSTPQPSNTFAGLSAGTYTVFVRDTVTQCTAFKSNIIVN